ncbi:hypothetical protein J7J47_15840 [Halomonas sp. ISL-60]|uniref:hypothetical protein n=1 Tax=Halomonas sp. ISL-56 TaxID=2819149 RepID=UPI001BE9790B|nr:hypothetical protein [Halomonas sp. ISL-56]MBT2773699.1 hypothetical protein [Halomonas sp. ISL-60]MBT2803198.1 hypothetical protein [Halomonas sp. ISL-56]
MNLSVVNWLHARGLTPPDVEHDDWGFKISASSVPLCQWVASKSKIPDKALWVGFTVNRLIGYRLIIMTKDQKLKLSWSGEGAPLVESPSLIHRKKTQWAVFHSPEDFPSVVKETNQFLDGGLLRELNMDVYSLKSGDLEILNNWLEPIAGRIKLTIGEFYGDVPDGLEVSDNRPKGTLKISYNL